MADIPKNHQNVLDFASLGKITKNTNTDSLVLEMPTLWSLDKNDKYRFWTLYLGISNGVDNEKFIDVTNDFINRGKMKSGWAAIYWTKSGVENTENPIISEKTYIYKGKNEKSKNYTTPFTQAILDARSDYNLKIRKGNVLDKSQLISSDQVISMDHLFTQTYRGDKPWRVFAMLLHDINKAKNWRHVNYPCKIQPKLDGTMFIVVYHPKLPEIEINIGNNTKVKVNMDGYSRGRETYEGQDHILYELYPVLKKYPGLHMTGELWKKGYGLQDISGSSRRQLDSKIKNDAIKLDFNIFDCFYIDRPDMTFDEREAIIDDILSEMNNPKYVKYINSYEVDNKDELMEKYETFLQEGMEGGVVRNLDSLYEVGIDKERRSYQTLKIKPRPDSEFPVINFKEGNGKESGAIIWICAESDDGVKNRTGKILPMEDRKSFSVTPNMSYEDRYAIFKKLSKDKTFFDKNIKGQLLTINYSILSKDFLPQQPKAIRFRDEKINELLFA